MKRFSIFRNELLLVFYLFTYNQTSNAQKWPGYTLIAPTNSTNAYLLDTLGNTFHTWKLNGNTGYSAHLIPGGTIVRAVQHAGNYFNAGPQCGQVQKTDYNGNVIWDYVYSTVNYCSHHDICPMPNGNVLLIAYELRTAAEVIAAGSKSNLIMWPDKIVEVKPTGATTGEVVWEWKSFDHLVQNVDPSKKNYYPSISDHPELLDINYKTTKDWLHMNGVDYNAELDQIAFSSHNLNEIYVIDHSTTMAEAASHSGGKYGKGGDLLYRWGNPQAYGASGAANFKVVHDAHWVPAGCPRAGSLVGFNNQGVSNTKSSVDIIAPPYTDDSNYSKIVGAAFEPTTYTYRHAANGFTSNEGGSQQLPNGNMIVCVAKAGYVYEVDANEKVLWSTNVNGGLSQAFRYSKCYIEGTLADKPVISKVGELLMSNDASTYQWYLNGLKINGATEREYTPTQSGKYQVIITNSGGCESEISDVFKYIKTTAQVDDIDIENDFKVYPNPTHGKIFLWLSKSLNENDGIRITNIVGLVVCQISGMPINNEIDVSHLFSGIYFIELRNSNSHKMIKKCFNIL